MSSVWYARLMNKDPEPPSSEYPSSQFNNTSPLAMLGSLHNQQQQQPQQPQPPQPQQVGQQGQPMLQQQPMQQQQPQQSQQGLGQQNGPMPPPPPLNGQDQQLSSILHFLQSEWRRYERDRNEWEVERAELRSRVALLEGERRSFENVKLDLMRRIKMLEYALKMERTKQLSQISIPGKQDLKQIKEDGSSQKGSVSSSPRSEDMPLPSEQRLSISGLPSNNGIPPAGPSSRKDPMAASWPGVAVNGNPPAIHLGKPLPGRDPKSRARSRDYLKQCLQEVNYLTSPPAMNPLPNRPLLPQPTMPLTIPNIPPIDPLGFNGRPRKGVPELGKDFPQLNGPMNFGAHTGNGQNVASGSNSTSQGSESQDSRPGHPQGPSFPQPVLMPQSQQQGSQHPLANAITPSDSGSEVDSSLGTEGVQDDEQRITESQLAMPTPEPYRIEEPTFQGGRLGLRETDEEGAKGDETLLDEGISTEGTTEGDPRKVWTGRRTLRSHLDAVRAMAFHPMELCLATGGDDYTVKIWRLSPSELSSGAAAIINSDIEPQVTYRGHTAPITRLAISATKGLLYSASLDSTIHVWAIPPAVLPYYAPYNPSRSQGVLVGHTDAVWDIALTREDTILVSCGAEGLVKVWTLTGNGAGSLKLSWGFDGVESIDGDRKEEVGATAVEPIRADLKKVAVAYQNSVIKLFNLETGVQLGILHIDAGSDAPVGQVNRLASHPALPLLVSAHEDKSIRIFDILTGQCTYSMLAHLDAVTSTSIDRAGFSLVSGSHDCSIRFWDLINTRSCVQEIQNHREKAHEGVLDVAFHPALPFMASSGADGSVKLYTSESS